MKFWTLAKQLTIVLLVFGLSFGAGTYITHAILDYTMATQAPENTSTAIDIDGERVNILLLGSDKRPGEEVTRSDSMVLCSADPDLKKIVFLFIPRDTKWQSARYGTNKLNAAHALGGPQLSRETIEQLLGIKIDYYVEVDFYGFIDVIDAVGGVEIDVKERMYKKGDYIDIQPGLQTLNGYQSLGYMRYRGYLMGDADRDAHQAVFIKALTQKMLDPANVIKLPEIIRAVNDSIMTDMSLMNMLELAAWAPAFDPDDVITQCLPGWYDNGYDGAGNLISCYWIVDKNVTHSILDDLYAGNTFEEYEEAGSLRDVEDPFEDENGRRYDADLARESSSRKGSSNTDSSYSFDYDSDYDYDDDIDNDNDNSADNNNDDGNNNNDSNSNGYDNHDQNDNDNGNNNDYNNEGENTNAESGNDSANNSANQTSGS